MGLTRGSAIAVLLLMTAAVAACDQQRDRISDEETALPQSATMGTTTQQQVSGSQATLGDASQGTSPEATVDQYGPTGGVAGTGDATADTTAGGAAGGLSGATGTGMAGTTRATGLEVTPLDGGAATGSGDDRAPR